jgi:predicted amidohydrolase
MHPMQIIAIQLDIVWEDPAANLAKVGAMLGSHEIEAGALIVLPEMFSTGFTMNVNAAAREHEKTIQGLHKLAQEHQCQIVAGVALPGTAGKGQNRAIVLDPHGQLIASYTKLHPFSVGGEKDHYEAGREILIFRCGPFQVAPFVCYDLRFPEIFRRAVKKGADFFVVIANWPIARVEHWITLLRARAIENQSYVLGVNRTGRDPNTLYPGRSILVDPMGIIRADAGDSETLLLANADYGQVRQIRTKLPFLQDLRDDLAL